MAQHGEGLAGLDVAGVEAGRDDQVVDRRQAVLARQSDHRALIEGVGHPGVARHRVVGDARGLVDPPELQQGARCSTRSRALSGWRRSSSCATRSAAACGPPELEQPQRRRLGEVGGGAREAHALAIRREGVVLAPERVVRGAEVLPGEGGAIAAPAPVTAATPGVGGALTLVLTLPVDHRTQHGDRRRVVALVVEAQAAQHRRDSRHLVARIGEGGARSWSGAGVPR